MRPARSAWTGWSPRLSKRWSSRSRRPPEPGAPPPGAPDARNRPAPPRWAPWDPLGDSLPAEMGGLLIYVLVAGLAAVLAYLLTPVVRWIALRYDAVDRPGDRKVHAVATPTLGGLAMFLAFIGALAVSSRLFRQLFLSSEAAGVAIGASLMTAIGI